MGGGRIGPATIYRAQRTQAEALGYSPASVVHSLLALPELVGGLAG
jgi:hypothetical protein